QRLVEKLDIGLQAAGAALHLRLRRALFEPTNILSCGRRKKGAGDPSGRDAKPRGEFSCEYHAIFLLRLSAIIQKIIQDFLYLVASNGERPGASGAGSRA